MAVGDWELIPRCDLGDGDCLDARTKELASGLADIYALPRQASSRVGAFAQPRQGHVGDDPQDRKRLHDLQRAMAVAVLDLNESPVLTEEERDPNFGHYAMTSDNATVVAHGINREGGYTGAMTGSRVRRMDLGLSVLEDLEDHGIPRLSIPPPADLRLPLRQPRLDAAYADATWESVRRGDDSARRLGRAIDWLHLAWLNTTALSDDLRVPALRAGFEVLLDTGDYLELARHVGELLRDDTAPITPEWRNRSGKVVTENLATLRGGLSSSPSCGTRSCMEVRLVKRIGDISASSRPTSASGTCVKQSNARLRTMGIKRSARSLHGAMRCRRRANGGEISSRPRAKLRDSERLAPRPTQPSGVKKWSAMTRIRLPGRSSPTRGPEFCRRAGSYSHSEFGS
jgi:hypothetical protein